MSKSLHLLIIIILCLIFQTVTDAVRITDIVWTDHGKLLQESNLTTRQPSRARYFTLVIGVWFIWQIQTFVYMGCGLVVILYSFSTTPDVHRACQQREAAICTVKVWLKQSYNYSHRIFQSCGAKATSINQSINQNLYSAPSRYLLRGARDEDSHLLDFIIIIITVTGFA